MQQKPSNVSPSEPRRATQILSLVVLIAGVSLTNIAHAASTACPESFLDGTPPQITNVKMAAQTRALCYSAFAVMHSGSTRTPLWSASHLTRDSVNSAKGLTRVNAFHAEAGLPVTERSELRDFSRSGFDRGHMFPSGDAPTAVAQQETFSLANMIPQNPDNNRHLWEGIESAVRTLARGDGNLFIVTGPLFSGANLQQLNGRVLVPTQIYKVVYSPQRNAAAVYLVDNADGMKYTVISVAQAEKLAGINFFPTMAASIKNVAMALPAPRLYGGGGKSRPEQSGAEL